MTETQRDLGTQLANALSDEYMAEGHSRADASAYTMGYIKGILDDIADRFPDARGIVQYHLERARARGGAK